MTNDNCCHSIFYIHTTNLPFCGAGQTLFYPGRMPKKEPLQELMVGYEILDDDEEEDEEEEESELSSEATVEVQSESEISSEYKGHVKNLARMYDAFAKAISEEETKKKVFPVTSVSQKAAASMQHLKESGDSPTSVVASCPGGSSQKPRSSVEMRLGSLETKASAIITFVGDLIMGEIETLGSQYLHQVKTDKNVDMMKTDIKAFDGELDEVHEQLEEVQVSRTLLQKENKRLRHKLRQLEQMLQTENSETRKVILDLSKKVDRLSLEVAKMSKSKCGVGEVEMETKLEQEKPDAK